MSKKIVYSKSEHGIGDFVYVDLLPHVRRARQFNMNVIVALLFAVVLTYTLVFIPIRAATIEYEALNGTNNDLKHELLLTREEFDGYEINLDIILFETEISGLEGYRVDFNNLLDDVELVVDEVSGNISFISYSAEIHQLRVTVELGSRYTFSSLKIKLLNIPWVLDAEATDEEEDDINDVWVVTYTLEVNPNVE